MISLVASYTEVNLAAILIYAVSGSVFPSEDGETILLTQYLHRPGLFSIPVTVIPNDNFEF